MAPDFKATGDTREREAGTDRTARLEQNYAGHYLHSTPSPVPAIATISLALLLLAAGITELRTMTRTASIQIASTDTEIAEGAAVFTVMAEGWALDGQPVEEADLVFRLSGAAGRSPVIVVEHTTGLSATRLTRALDLVNQAGFTQVGLKATPQ